MTRLIGVRCKHGNVLSRDVLIARILIRKLLSHIEFAPASQDEARFASIRGDCPAK